MKCCWYTERKAFTENRAFPSFMGIWSITNSTALALSNNKQSKAEKTSLSLSLSFSGSNFDIILVWQDNSSSPKSCQLAERSFYGEVWFVPIYFGNTINNKSICIQQEEVQTCSVIFNHLEDPQTIRPLHNPSNIRTQIEGIIMIEIYMCVWVS